MERQVASAALAEERVLHHPRVALGPFQLPLLLVPTSLPLLETIEDLIVLRLRQKRRALGAQATGGFSFGRLLVSRARTFWK